MTAWNVTIKRNDHIVACHNVATERQAIRELTDQGFLAQRVDALGTAHYHRPVRKDGDQVLPGLHGEIRRIGT